MPDPMTTDNLKALVPGLVIRSPAPVKHDMIDYAQILCLGRNESANQIVITVASSHYSIVVADGANFKHRFGHYLIHKPGDPLDGRPLSCLVPLSRADQKMADDLLSAIGD
jgi:hypothetical protein